MTIVQPSAVYLAPTGKHAYEHIERIGRTCYKSEEKIAPGTAENFVNMLISKHHWAMLEHAYVYYPVIYGHMMKTISHLPDYVKKYLNIVRYVAQKGSAYENRMAMTASLTAIKQCMDECRNIYDSNGTESRIVSMKEIRAAYDFYQFMIRGLNHHYPEIFPTGVNPRKENLMPVAREIYIETILRDLPFINFIEDDKEDTDEDRVFKYTLPHTIKFTVDRGVTHELVRHRPASFAQESTRYCNYEKGKFGGEITVVEPFWAKDPEKSAKLYPIWLKGCSDAENTYMAMISAGATPQEARAVLPTETKNDIYVTTTEAEWEHILNLRYYGTTGAPHPDMKRVMAIAGKLLWSATNGRLYSKEY